MATTQLFVELLVIGAGAILWLGQIAGILGIRLGASICEPNALVVGVVTALAYVMGIVVDRVSRLLFWWPERHYEHSLLLDGKLPPQRDTHRYLLLRGPALAPLIEYNRSRLRVCRAWCLNLLVVTIALAVSRGLGGAGAARRVECALIELPGSPSLAMLAGGALLTLITGSVAVWLIRDHYRNLAESYVILEAWKATEQERSPDPGR